MATYELTATTDVRAGKYSGVKAHVNRSTKNHSNKDIDVSKSYLNTGETLLDYDVLKQEHYGDHVEQVNKNRRGAKGKSNSKYENVDDYLARTKGEADTTFVQWFGNSEDWAVVKADLMAKGLTEEDIASGLDAGYSVYAEGFNDRNEYIKIQEWRSHHDEHTPHYHGRMFTQGVTKTGKPSKTLNSALSLQFPQGATNQERIKLWRDQEDNAFFGAVSAGLVQKAKEKGINASFELYRKDEHNGLTMSQYKENKANEEFYDDIHAQILEATEQLQEFEVRLNTKEKSLDKRESELDRRESDLADYKNDLDVAFDTELQRIREEDEREREEYKRRLQASFRKQLAEKKANLGRQFEKARQRLSDTYMNTIDFVQRQPISKRQKEVIQGHFVDTYEGLNPQEKHKETVTQREPVSHSDGLEM